MHLKGGQGALGSLVSSMM